MIALFVYNIYLLHKDIDRLKKLEAIILKS